MQLALRDNYEWHQVPFAWFPQEWNNRLYWLERPPVERRAKFNDAMIGYVWEYRDK